MSHTHINNTEFYYELHGEGHPLVLVSGYAADHRGWLPLVERLKKHFQILIFDNRGIGQTRETEALPLSIDIFADDMHALITALKLKKPHVIGQSMGGAIVQSFAARYPEALSKLGILNSTYKWRQAMLLGIKSFMNVAREASFDTFFTLNLAWLFGEAFLQDPEKIAARRALFVNNPNPPTPANLLRQYAALEGFDGRANLAKIKAPTLVVASTEDIISLPAESRVIAEGIAGARYVELQSGHGIVAEIPDELTGVLLDFLRA